MDESKKPITMRTEMRSRWKSIFLLAFFLTIALALYIPLLSLLMKKIFGNPVSPGVSTSALWAWYPFARIFFTIIYFLIAFLLGVYIYRSYYSFSLRSQIIIAQFYTVKKTYSIVPRSLAKVIDELILLLSTFLFSALLTFLTALFLIFLALIEIEINIPNKMINIDPIPIYLALSFFYYLTFWRSGQTIGMQFFNLILLDKDKNHLTIKQALLRFFLDLVAKLTLGLPYLTIFAKKRQTLVDKLSKTYVYEGEKEKANCF